MIVSISSKADADNVRTFVSMHVLEELDVPGRGIGKARFLHRKLRPQFRTSHDLPELPVFDGVCAMCVVW